MITKNLKQLYEFTKNRGIAIAFAEKPILVTNPIINVVFGKGETIKDINYLQELGFIIKNDNIYIPPNKQLNLYWGKGLEPNNLECQYACLNTVIEDEKAIFYLDESCYPANTDFS